MSGERLPSPDSQVRRALEVARAAGMPFDLAWPLAVHGHVCDDYRSARGRATREPATPGPDLRASDGQKRCAGCKFVVLARDGTGALAGGLSRCGLHDRSVFAGVLWPHRTDDRGQWRAAIETSVAEWGRSYRREPSPVARVLSAIRAHGQVMVMGEPEAPANRGHVAA